MQNKVGRTRRKLAEKIITAFKLSGFTVDVDPENLIPTQGHWRTSRFADCMPWHGNMSLLVKGKWLGHNVESWDTMTDLLHGFTFYIDGSNVELCAKQIGVKQARQRNKAR